MKQNPSIRLKAAFLLFVFSLNTVIGFACSIGMDGSFSRPHHKHENADIHHKDTGHHHSHKAAKNAFRASHDKGHCCNDEVIKYASVDKVSPQSPGSTVVFITAFLSSFRQAENLAYPPVIVRDKYFVRSHHPPITDIRVAIQSFQI